ncbi:MAG: DNA repair protein RadC [candidate division WOR-3 bacterium]
MKEPTHRTFTVHDLPQRERPRERLMREGPKALTREEVLAIIISRGTKGRSVLDIARDLVRRFKTIGAIADATIEELQQIEGIGRAKACQLKAALELARRIDEPPDDDSGAELDSPEAVVRLMAPKLRGEKKECFHSLVADSRRRLVTRELVSLGSLDTTLAHPREVFQEAIRAKASGIVVVHNHPSGDPTPSEDDVRLTRRLVEAGRIIGIPLLDHIIIAGDKHYSFRSRGLL